MSVDSSARGGTHPCTLGADACAATHWHAHAPIHTEMRKEIRMHKVVALSTLFKDDFFFNKI